MKDGRTQLVSWRSAPKSAAARSQFYCKEPLFPLADTSAMVNIDMVGKLRSDPMTRRQAHRARLGTRRASIRSSRN